MANDTSNYPDFVFVTYDEDFSAQTHDVAVSLEAGSLVGVPVKYVRHDLNTRPAQPVEGLETNAYGNFKSDGKLVGLCEELNTNWKGGEALVTRSQAETIIAALKKDRLPDGHTILEQADIHDGTGRISQTVRVEATGEEYERIVHADEAYGEDE